MARYEPNQPYEYSDISGPIHYAVPPPDLNNAKGKHHTVTFTQGTTFSGASDKYGDCEFLTELSRCQPLQFDHVMLQWQYHHKVKAQDILPFLYLGPFSIARDPEFIDANDITMLLAVRDGRSAKLNPKIMDPARFASAKGIETATFDPCNELDMLHRFDSPIRLMIEHLKARTKERPVTKLSDVGGKILVFCEAGDQRSAAVVVLFIMVVFGLPAANAIQAVQAKRYGIAIRGEFDRMLRNCEDILRAEKQVALSSRSGSDKEGRFTTRSQKRTIHQAWDEDDEMDDVSVEGETHRSGITPFRDVDMSSKPHDEDMNSEPHDVDVNSKPHDAEDELLEPTTTVVGMQGSDWVV